MADIPIWPEIGSSSTNHETSSLATAPYTVAEERTVYLISRQQEVRCRLWYEVTPLREGILKYFLLGIQELET